jgi:hypothetical protein
MSKGTYILKPEGIGKAVHNVDGMTGLYPTLSQRQLKRLFTLKCEFIEYVEQTKAEETQTSGSTSKASTRKGGKRKKNNSVQPSGREQDTGEGTAEFKAD